MFAAPSKQRLLLMLALVCLALGAYIGTGNAAITLTWEASPDARVTGHIVHYGTSPGAYDVHIDVGKATRYQLQDLDSDTTYYFAVTSCNARGEQSRPSAEVSTANTFLATVVLYNPLPALLVFKLRFDFTASHNTFVINPDGSHHDAVSGRVTQEPDTFFAEYTFGLELFNVYDTFTAFLAGNGNVSCDRSISGEIQFYKPDGLLKPRGIFWGLRQK